MAKNKVLQDPIKPRFRASDRTFVAPDKENATTGRFMAPGDMHGVGFRTPVGKEKPRSYEDGPIPMKAVCFPSSEAL